MKKAHFYLAICMFIMITAGCDENQIIPGTGTSDEFIQMDARKGAKIQPMMITGFVELVWKGENKGGDMGNKPDELRTFMDITAIEGTASKDPRGELLFTVLETDLSPHREIRAKVMDVLVDPGQMKGWIVALVTYDSKGCAGNGTGGHGDGCAGSGEDPSSHDGGCSHEETDEGGCTHEETDEGGCTHEETDEGGCSGSDTGSGMPGGSAGSDNKGNPVSGKNCRVGQILAVKTHDGGTPGRTMDGITWKWFDPNGDFIPGTENISSWPHLCKKEIIEGNIVIHIP